MSRTLFFGDLAEAVPGEDRLAHGAERDGRHAEAGHRRLHVGLHRGRLLGDGGAGLEYRFTPHIGLFSDVRYNVVNGPKNNYLSTRFGLRYAF